MSNQNCNQKYYDVFTVATRGKSPDQYACAEIDDMVESGGRLGDGYFNRLSQHTPGGAIHGVIFSDRTLDGLDAVRAVLRADAEDLEEAA